MYKVDFVFLMKFESSLHGQLVWHAERISLDTRCYITGCNRPTITQSHVKQDSVTRAAIILQLEELVDELLDPLRKSANMLIYTFSPKQNYWCAA